MADVEKRACFARVWGVREARKFFLAMMLGVAVLVSGCTHMQVKPMANRHVANLSARDVVEVMKAAGFSEKEIVRLGPGLRNVLAARGSAQIQRGERVEAIFAVEGHYLHVSSRRRGMLIYDLEEHAFQGERKGANAREAREQNGEERRRE
jgi:hypothetical protein